MGTIIVRFTRDDRHEYGFADTRNSQVYNAGFATEAEAIACLDEACRQLGLPSKHVAMHKVAGLHAASTERAS